jgi:hypothetical protein
LIAATAITDGFMKMPKFPSLVAVEMLRRTTGLKKMVAADVDSGHLSEVSQSLTPPEIEIRIYYTPDETIFDEGIEDGILRLYRGALGNRHVDRKAWNSIKDMADYLTQFREDLVAKDTIEVLVVASFQGFAGSFVYGAFNQTTGIFSLWYYVSARDWGRLNPEQTEFYRRLGPLGAWNGVGPSMLTRLGAFILERPEARYITYEVDKNENDRVPIQLVHFDRVLQRVRRELGKNPAAKLDAEGSSLINAYVVDFKYVLPHNRGRIVREREYTLVCVPLDREMQIKFSSGSISFEDASELYGGILRTYYDYLSGLRRDTFFGLAAKLYDAFKERYLGQNLPTPTLSEFIERQ